MTERLRELFDEMVAEEPPLRISADTTVAAGRRLRRNRTLWTVGGTALAVAVAAAVPALWTQAPWALPPADPASVTTSRSGSPTGSATATPSATPSPSPSPSASPTPSASPSPSATRTRTPGPLSLEFTSIEVCPAPNTVPQPPVVSVPNFWAARDAVLAEGPRVAPGMTFISLSNRELVYGGWFELRFDVGDAAGYGLIQLSVQPDETPIESRIGRGLSADSPCVEGWRHDFADGSVAVYYPGWSYTIIYYFAPRFTVWAFVSPQPFLDVGDPNRRPTRGSDPLTPEQALLLAHAIATA